MQQFCPFGWWVGYHGLAQYGKEHGIINREIDAGHHVPAFGSMYVTICMRCLLNEAPTTIMSKATSKFRLNVESPGFQK
jgi:hypothetical protein